MLRLATMQDAPAVAALYAPYVANTTISFECQPPGADEMARRIGKTLAAFPWLCAEANGQLLGYAYAGRFGSRQGYDWAALTSIYLAPHSQRRGLGRRLYGALLALLARQGYRNAYAGIAVPNPASEAFHQHMGFARQGHFPGIGGKFGQPVALSYYARPLAPFVPNAPPPLPLPALAAEEVAAILHQAQQAAREG